MTPATDIPQARARSGRGGGHRPPPPALAPVVRCLWWATAPERTTTVHVLPDACADLVWTGAGAFVAGPDTGPVATTLLPGQAVVGLRLRPEAAGTVLGVPASAVLDARVPLADLWGDQARALDDALAAAADDRARAALLEVAVARRLAHGAHPAPDPAVARVVAALRRAAERPGTAGTPPPVARLAAGLGLSERQLLRRCTRAVGYGPRPLGRVLRFQRFLAEARHAPGTSLADLAVTAGYADQAHLAHEARRLGGLTPTALLGR